jgi:hypothetical protein
MFKEEYSNLSPMWDEYLGNNYHIIDYTYKLYKWSNYGPDVDKTSIAPINQIRLGTPVFTKEDNNCYNFADFILSVEGLILKDDLDTTYNYNDSHSDNTTSFTNCSGDHHGCSSHDCSGYNGCGGD